LAVPVVTVAGYVDASRQSIERGEMVGSCCSPIWPLITTRNWTPTDQRLRRLGQHLVCWVCLGERDRHTDASQRIPELWPSWLTRSGAMSQRFTGPTAMVSHPNLWAWLLAERDTTGRPMFGRAASRSTVGNDRGDGLSATAQGQVMVPFVADGNVPTNPAPAPTKPDNRRRFP
jgi:hypothetical protein